MRRRISIITATALAIALASCSLGTWLALQPDTGRFVVPGASNPRVQHIRPGTLLITFMSTDADVDWASQLDRQLRAQGWLPPDYSGASAQFTIYSYVNQWWFGSVWEEAELQGDAQHARITVRRWLRLPWLFGRSIGF